MRVPFTRGLCESLLVIPGLSYIGSDTDLKQNTTFNIYSLLGT
jgi:hypothetical protein